MWQKVQPSVRFLPFESDILRLFRPGAIPFGANDRRTDPPEQIDFRLGEAAASEKSARHGHEELGILGVMYAASRHRLFPMSEKALDRLDGGRTFVFKTGLPVVQGVGMAFRRHERHMHFVGRDLHRLSQIETRTRRIGCDGGAPLAQHDLFVRHAAAFGTENEGNVALHPVEPGHGLLGGRAQRRHRRSELPVIPRQSPSERHPFQGVGQRLVATRGLENVDGTRGIGDRLLMSAIVGFARIHNAQIPKSHGLDGASGRTDIARMCRFAKDEPNPGGKLRNIHV